MKFPFFSWVHYHRSVFKSITIFTLVIFCWAFIFPVALAAKEASERSGRAGTGTQEKHVSDEEELSSTLEEVEEKLGKLEEKLAKGEDDSLEKDDLKKLKKKLRKLDQKAKENFQKIEKDLKGKKLPQVILDRHYQAQAVYQTEVQTLLNNLEDVEKARADGDRKVKTKKAKEHLEKKQKKRTHKIFDPETLPFHTPDGEKRREKISNTTYNLTPFQPAPVHVAALGLVPGLLAGPATHAAPGPDDLAPTLEVPLTPEIQALAAELGGTSVELYEFVRNNFVYEPYAGSVKGAAATLLEHGGNDWDLASLLIALLRAGNIPVRYVTGTVEIPIDRAMSWLGVEDPKMAGNLLASIGRNTSSVITGGKITALRTEHVWVRAYVPFEHHRGAIAGPGDTWIDLDPSFKLQNAAQTLKPANVPAFDQTAYLSTYRVEGPLDFYRTQLQGFLDANAPGYVPAALGRTLEIIPEMFGVLPAQLPYTVLTEAKAYTAIPGDARQTFTLNITDQLGFPQLAYTAPLPEIVDKRLTLFYSPAAQADADVIASYGGLYNAPAYLVNLKPQVKLEGVVVAEGSAIGAGQEQTLDFIFSTPNGTDRAQNFILAGEYYAIALNAQKGSGTHQEILDRAKRLEGVQAAINLADPATLDDRMGELLYLSSLLYLQNLNMADREIEKLSHIIDIRQVSEMMYFLTAKVSYFFGVPRTIMPVGITADMDRNTHLVIPVDGDMNHIKPFITLSGAESSYLEHHATEKVYNAEAISAVKGIQLAHDQGIPVHTITSQNINTLLPSLQVSEGVKTDIQNTVNQGWEAVVPERNLTLLDWTGVGYVLQTPGTGEGYYRISGGYGGAAVVQRDLMVDLLRAVGCSDYAGLAINSAEKPQICYPGTDNILHTSPDSCFTVVLMDDIDPEEKVACGKSDPDCKIRYYSLPYRSWVTQPLIDSTQHQYLTRHIQTQAWRSTDGSRYIRVGLAVLTAIEWALEVYQMTIVELTSAYRSYTRALELARKENPDASTTTHHMDGVAADFTLKVPKEVPEYPIPDAWKNPWTLKPDLLCTADYFVKTMGEVLFEDTGKSTVHIAVPGIYNRDYNGFKGKKFSWSCP